MVVRISGNIDDLKKSLADGKAVIDGAAVSIKKLGDTAGGDVHKSFQKFDSILASLGLNVGNDVRAIGELTSASGQSAASLGSLATAGMAAGAAFAGWKIGRWIADLGDFDDQWSELAAKLLGFGDVAAQRAFAGIETLSRASKMAGTNITDMELAVALLSGAAEANAKAVNTSANRIAGWNQEIAKVKDEGNWSKLTSDVSSQNFELKELSDRYHISVDAIEFFTKQQKKADDEITESNQRKLEQMKHDAAAQKEAQAEAEKLNIAMTHLAFAQGNYTDILAHTDPKLVDAIQHYKELGLSVTDTATILGVADSTVDLVSEALEHQNDTLDAAHAKWQALEKAQKEACDNMLGNALAAVAAQKKAFDDLQDQITKQMHVYEGITSSQTYDLSTREGMDYFLRQNTDARLKGAALNPDYFKTHTIQQAIAAGLLDMYGGWKERGFADGGSVTSSGSYLVGEKGPEIIDLPQGAYVTPNHQLGGMTIHVGGVVVNGSVLGTQHQFADLIGDALMAKMRGIGDRFPVTAGGGR
jgi:hypothetical protein